MKPPLAHLPALELRQGEVLVVERPAAVVTILGSCLAVTLFSRRLGVASICHALLPEAKDPESELEPFRYVDTAVGRMVREFRRRGAGARETEVKVFGGGDVLLPAGGRAPTVGARNAQVAFSELRRLGYEIAASDVGGPRGRKLYFDTATGEVYVKKLSKALVGAKP